MSEPPRVFAHCPSLSRRSETALRLSSVRLGACSELDLLTLFQPIPSPQVERHGAGFLLNKSGRGALSAQTAKRPVGVVPCKEIPGVTSIAVKEPKR